MIKINLIAERKVATRKKAAFDVGQKLTIGCSLILVVTALLVGWRYWSLGQQSSKLDADIVAAQKEAKQLHSVITQVQQFEQRKTQLQQRVQLIEQLRQEQTGPVHMLDQVSRALPPMMWLTGLTQTENPNEVEITGKCVSLTGLSDFVGNLEGSGYFKRSVEILKSQTEAVPTPPGELVSFSIRAVFQRPGAPAEMAPEPAKLRATRNSTKG
jgi:type IV pilus assembly protein PilN